MRIIPRSEWGAHYSNGLGTAPLPVKQVWLHHSVTAPLNGHAAILALEQIGENRFGGGISYTWVITPNGEIYEGHGVDRLGSHTAGRNSVSRAICLIGNYDQYRASEEQLNAIGWLLKTGYENGWLTVPKLTGGHRDLRDTACPGEYAYRQIPEMNLRVHSATTTAEETDMRTFFVHGDGESPWGDYVFLVEATADGLYRRHVDANEWYCHQQNGAKLLKRPQNWVDSLLYGRA